MTGEDFRRRRKQIPTELVATGSAALRLAAGSHESLAGRFERITLTHLSAASMALFGSSGRSAMEVMTGPCQPPDLRALLELVRRHPGLRPIVVCHDAAQLSSKRAGVAAVSWRRFLVERLGPGE